MQMSTSIVIEIKPTKPNEDIILFEKVFNISEYSNIYEQILFRLRLNDIKRAH